MGKLQVLIIEDDPDVRFLIAEYVESAGHSVRLADHGQHALDLLTHFRPHIILLDIAMPVMDGLTFLGRKRNFPEIVNIPVIVISATAEPPIDGARCVLRKPVEPSDLLAAVHQFSAAGLS